MSLISDLAQHLHNNGIGSLADSIYYGYSPADKEVVIAVLDTGGLEPDKYIPTNEPTFQIFIRDISYDAGKAKLDAVRALLHRLANQLVGSTYFYFILAIAEGGHLGRDDAGLDLFSINFRARTR